MKKNKRNLKFAAILALVVILMSTTSACQQTAFANSSQEFLVKYNTSVFTRYIFEDEMARATTINPITVVESDQSIKIYAYLLFTGDAANTLLDVNENVTYKQAAIEGIKNSWNGTYKGKKVEVILVDLSDGYPHITKTGQRSLTIEINPGLGQCMLAGVENGAKWSKGMPGKIVMFQEDIGTRNKFVYISLWKTTFGNAVGHEFGHGLGVHHPKNDRESIMRTPRISATEIDYDYVFHAQLTNTWQNEGTW